MGFADSEYLESVLVGLFNLRLCVLRMLYMCKSIDDYFNIKRFGFDFCRKLTLIEETR